MSKTILITGATSGIGLEASRALHRQGHRVILHGRSFQKIAEAIEILQSSHRAEIDNFEADVSKLNDVERLASDISARYPRIDVIINNAGVFRSSISTTQDGLDLRFAVNTYAPALLTDRLLPLLSSESRVINLSSSAQAPVNISALEATKTVEDQFQTYAQSKLALTMWTRLMAGQTRQGGPLFIAVNPGSMLATRMVQEGFGAQGKDITIGSGILVRCATDETFAKHSGEYFDNDSGRFAPPHPDALNDEKCRAVFRSIASVLSAKGFPLTNR
ncbi:MAG: SDR family NAD(P)-dependent oxidoreductase [Pseudomonadota bacterium]